MDKGILKHPLILIASFFLLLAIFSRFGVKLPISVISQEKGQPLVVDGEGKVTAVPDTAKVTVGIEESGTSLKDVQKRASTKSKTLVDTLKKLGIDDKQIKTTSYNVYPEYNYESGTPRITGYKVSSSYEVTVKDFDKVNDVLVEAVNAGARVVGNISFEVNEETKGKLLDEARQKAVKEAKEKAQSLATAAGVSLGKILNISESLNTPGPVPIALREAGIGGTEPRPEITPGETEISVVVSISFEIR